MCTPACYRWSAYVTPKSPKGWHKNTILLFLPAKFKFCRKTSAAMFLFEKASRDKVVATSFLYLTVHRRIAGDVPIYLRFALQVTHPFRKHRFQPISLINASAVRASEKSSIITNTKSRKCFPSSHRWTVYVIATSPKGWHTRFWFLPVKLNSCRKNLLQSFFVWKLSASFLYSMVHRWIAGDGPIYLEFALKVTHPFRKCRFR